MKDFLNKVLEAFKDWLSRRLPDCKEVTPTIGESLDRKLSWSERLVMKLHLFTCDRCGRYLQQLGFLNKTLRRHGEEIADPEPTVNTKISEDSKDRIKQLLARTACNES